jgi:NAD(P)-dependent dehydrogenase (short-subunit alcohol dehydrogenase family)
MSHLRAFGIEFLTIIAVLIALSALQNSFTVFHILAATIALPVAFVCSTKLVLWQMREPTAGPIVFRLRTEATPKKLIAGIAPRIRINDPNQMQMWDQVINVCLRGVFLALRAESKAMVDAGKPGVIINIASINAIVPAEGMSAYCTAKAGVEMLTRCAAMELGPHRVRVVGIGPGFVETPLTEYARAIPAVQDAYIASIPLGRAGTPGDIANAAVFLASDEASWITGTTIYVDGAEANKGYPDLGALIRGG